MKTNHGAIVIGIYALLFATILVVLKTWFFRDLFNVDNFLNWDAAHYYRIKDSGYKGFEVAFFPLFPLVWKTSGLGTIPMALANVGLFLVSFYLLIRSLKPSLWETLIYVTIPSFIFFFLPYAESIFFLSSVILVLGLKKDKLWMIALGLLLVILSRLAFTIIIPALVIAELLSENKGRIFHRIGLYLAVTVLGILLVGLVQYIDTNEWFNFFIAQKVWGSELQIPELPLTSWAGGFIVRLDGAAFLIGTISGALLTAVILKLKPVRSLKIPKEVIFSLAYLGGISLSILLFRGGSLAGLNRYVFAAPFIIVSLDFWFKHSRLFDWKWLASIALMIFSFWLLFESYVHIQTLLKFLFVTGYLFLLFSVKSTSKILGRVSTIVLIGLNIAFQVILYVRFLTGLWVG